MAYQTIPGGFLTPPPVDGWLFGGSGSDFTNLFLDASTEKVAFILRATKAGNISNIGFKLGTTTTGDTLRVSLQNVDATTGVPDGTADQSGTVVVANGDDDVWKTATLGSSRTVSIGDVFAVVIEFDSWVAGNLVIQAHGALGGGSRMPFCQSTYVAEFSGSWSRHIGVHPNVAVGYDDSTYARILGAFPMLTVGSTNINTGTNPDEIALKFKFPVRCKISGGYVTVDTTNSVFDVVLYDSDGSTALATVSVDGDITPENGTMPYAFGFTEQILQADTFYYLAVKPTSGTNVGVNRFTVNAAGHMDGFSGGRDFYQAVRENAGSWTDSTTTRPAFGVLVSAIDTGGTMAASFEGGEVVLTGATPVTVVAAPASGEQKQVLSLLAKNRDTATRTLTLQKKKGGTTHDVEAFEMAAGATQELVRNSLALDATDETAQVVSDATAATTEPLVHVCAFKVSQ